MVSRFGFVATVLLGGGLPCCQAAGVGDPCVPEDEYQAFFSGYELTELDLETRSVQCATRVCLVNHFQGRVSCPYGQSLANGAPARCHIPGTSGPAGAIRVDVRPQLTNRRADDAVYCSCRCDGPDPLARYCHCPEGFACTELMRDVGLGSAELSGSYCIKAGTAYDPFAFTPQSPCNVEKQDCPSESE
jgi:hypothetical protein